MVRGTCGLFFAAVNEIIVEHSFVLQSSFEIVFNSVAKALQCKNNLMNWFSSGFCMYRLGHADERAPHIFVSSYSIPFASIVNTFLFDFSELNTVLTIRQGMFVFEHLSKMYLFLFEHDLRRENNMCDCGKNDIVFLY